MAYTTGNLSTVGQAKALLTRVKAALSAKATKVTNLIAAGNLAMLSAEGDLADSNIAAANVMLVVANATAGNIPTIGPGGQLTTGVSIATDAEFTEMLDEVLGSSGSTGA